jgi:hypothetical protein
MNSSTQDWIEIVLQTERGVVLRKGVESSRMQVRSGAVGNARAKKVAGRLRIGPPLES